MKKKFSLVELMLVMAIIGILVSLMIPMLGRSRSTARTIECLNEMRQYGGIRIEDNVIVHEDGPENITRNLGLN